MAVTKKRPRTRAGAKRAAPILSSLSTDWYWEQDAQLRFTRIDVQTGMAGERKLARRNLGRRPWETGVAIEGGWEAHQALLRARAPFREVQMWRDLDDGSRRYLSVSGEPVFDAKGRFAGYRGVGRDITEHKRGEQLLRLQHTVTRTLAEAFAAADGARGALRAICETEGWDCGEFWRADASGGSMRRFVNWVMPGVEAGARYAEMSGNYAFRRGEGMVGSVWQSGEPRWIPDALQDARATRKSLAEETGLRAALLCPVSSGGRVVGVLGFVCRKIRPPDEALSQALAAVATQLGLFLQRADSEARLRESEARFRRTFELAGSGVAHISLERRFLRVNRKLCEILGYAEEELIGGYVPDLSHPDDRETVDRERDRLYAGELDSLRIEKRYLRKDGSVIWAAATIALERDEDGRPRYAIAVYDDISARKAAEAALRESEERFRRTFELAGVGVAHIGADRRFQRMNRRLCEILGYPEDELVGRTGRELSHPEDLDVMNAERPRLYRGEIDALRGEKRYLRKDGSIVWVAYALALERDAGGRPLYEIAVYDDISARKAAEAALRESDARFRSLASLSSDWFWEQDTEYRFTRLEGRRVAGGDQALRERLIGTRRWDSGLAIEGGWDAHRAILEARGAFDDVLMWRRMSEGHLRYMRVSGEPMFAPDGRFTGYRGVGRDVTEEKRAERLLRMEHQVTRALADAQDEHEGLQAVLRAVCEEQRWSCGRFFSIDEERGEMRFQAGWGLDDAPINAFLEASRDIRFRRGEGLVGHAWARGEAVWAADTEHDPRSRRLALEVTGLHGAFVFPVMSSGHVLGAFSFVADQVREPDERLLQATRVLGNQVGQFLQRKRAEESMRRFRLAMDSSADMILLVDRAAMRYIDVNSTACRLLGYSREELLALGPQDVLDTSREELERAYDALIAHPADVGIMNGQYRCKDGSPLPFESTRRVLESAGRPLIVAIARDISERIAAQEALRESEARFRALTEMSSDFFWETDAEHRFTDVVHGPSYADQMGRLTGKAAWDFPSTYPDQAGWAAHRAKMDAHQSFRDFEFGRPWKHDSVRWFAVSGEPHFGPDGAFLGYRGVGRDITDVVLARERIASLAYHDPLTGLANRTSLAPALEQAVERTRRRGSRLAGVFLDLDGFKQINDRHGHDAGDLLLTEAARRLRAALRSSDPLARLGGDEFFVVLEDLPDNAPAERVAKKLLAAIIPPYDIGGGKEVHISASIGISIYPDDAGDAATLMKHADTAMYAAKQAGKNGYRFFTAGPAANDAKPAAELKTS